MEESLISSKQNNDAISDDVISDDAISDDVISDGFSSWSCYQRHSLIQLIFTPSNTARYLTRRAHRCLFAWTVTMTLVLSILSVAIIGDANRAITTAQNCGSLCNGSSQCPALAGSAVVGDLPTGKTRKRSNSNPNPATARAQPSHVPFHTRFGGHDPIGRVVKAGRGYRARVSTLFVHRSGRRSSLRSRHKLL